VKLNGVATNLREPKEALRHGVFLLPEDRKSEGIFGHLDVRENVILGYNPAAERQRQADPVGLAIDAPALAPAAPRRRIGLAPILVQAERRAFNAMRNSLGIRCSGPEDRITSLSGGNQQKALFARAALSHPAVLFLSEPTRGVDVGAKEEIYSAIDAFAKRGIAIVVSSSEISELMRLASRIYVLRNGRIVTQVVSDGTSEEDILKFMAG
jgi:ABC-type sugar transport system ATPase subunit